MKSPTRRETKKWRILFSEPKPRSKGKLPVLAVDESLWRRIRESIFPDRRLERGGYLFGRLSNGGRRVFHVQEFLPALSEDLLRQEIGMFSARAEFHAKALNRFACGEYDAIWELHSHPFSRFAGFSPVDNGSFPEFTRLWGGLEARPHVLRLVLGTEENGFCCELWDRDTRTRERITVMLIGRDGVQEVDT